jgi:error-prone DNA polymerase
MFLLFEDEFGTINLIVSKEVYERHRQLARAEPLLLARGRLERSQERALASVVSLDPRLRELAAAEQPEPIRPVINVLVRELSALEHHLAGALEEGPGAQGARLHSLPGAVPGQPTEEELAGAEVGSSIRAAAPPVQSFAMGRRR